MTKVSAGSSSHSLIYPTLFSLGISASLKYSLTLSIQFSTNSEFRWIASPLNCGGCSIFISLSSSESDSESLGGGAGGGSGGPHLFLDSGRGTVGSGVKEISGGTGVVNSPCSLLLGGTSVSLSLGGTVVSSSSDCFDSSSSSSV